MNSSFDNDFAPALQGSSERNNGGHCGKTCTNVSPYGEHADGNSNKSSESRNSIIKLFSMISNFQH